MNKWSRNLISLFVATLVIAVAVVPAVAEPILHDVRPGYGVTAIGWISDYHAPLRGSAADTRVYYLDSGIEGPTTLILGGTHSNEIAGIMAAKLFVERAVVTHGRLIVVPYANASGASHTDARHPEIGYYSLSTESGVRNFRYGNRLTNPEHQGPDPSKYIHYQSGQELSGSEARNLNRAYPGKADGTLTQQLAYAYNRLLLEEKVEVAFDLHEAGPSSRLANMIVANPKNLDFAVMAIVDLEMQGVIMNVEHSSENFRGLSHKEWGDHTPAASYLIETPNPAQDAKVVDPDVVHDEVNPLARRTATHLAMIDAVLDAHELFEGVRTSWIGLPQYEELVSHGLEKYLR
jgi:hypothetical protein